MNGCAMDILRVFSRDCAVAADHRTHAAPVHDKFALNTTLCQVLNSARCSTRIEAATYSMSSSFERKLANLSGRNGSSLDELTKSGKSINSQLTARYAVSPERCQAKHPPHS